MKNYPGTFGVDARPVSPSSEVGDVADEEMQYEDRLARKLQEMQKDSNPRNCGGRGCRVRTDAERPRRRLGKSRRQRGDRRFCYTTGWVRKHLKVEPLPIEEMDGLLPDPGDVVGAPSSHGQPTERRCGRKAVTEARVAYETDRRL